MATSWLIPMAVRYVITCASVSERLKSRNDHQSAVRTRCATIRCNAARASVRDMAKKGAKKSAVSTRATKLLTEQQIAYAIHRSEPDLAATDYGLAAARALGVDGARVFVTLVTTVDGQPTNAVVPVSGELDLGALASTVGAKTAELVEPRVAEKLTGYRIGGISPIAQRRHLPTIVDVSALNFPTIYVSAGNPDLVIEMSPDDLVRLTAARTAPLLQQ